MSAPAEGILRTTVRAADREIVRSMVAATRMFTAAEVDVAVELVDANLERGDASGYRFVFLDVGSETLGYACHGEIACTVGSHDLFWIAVHPDHQGRGLGRRLLAAVEEQVAAAGGRQIYIETSARSDYAPTQGFYTNAGYEVVARFPDFYAPGDDKLVYVRGLSVVGS